MNRQKPGKGTIWQNRNWETHWPLSWWALNFLKMYVAKHPQAGKQLSGGTANKIRLHLTNNQTERAQYFTQRDLPVCLSALTSPAVCWHYVQPTKGQGESHKPAWQRNSKCIPLVHTTQHNGPGTHQQHWPLRQTWKACTQVRRWNKDRWLQICTFRQTHGWVNSIHIHTHTHIQNLFYRAGRALLTCFPS